MNLQHKIFVTFIIYLVIAFVFCFAGIGDRFPEDILKHSLILGPFAVATTIGWDPNYLNIPIFIIASSIIFISIYFILRKEEVKVSASRLMYTFAFPFTWLFCGIVGRVYFGFL